MILYTRAAQVSQAKGKTRVRREQRGERRLPRHSKPFLLLCRRESKHAYMQKSWQHRKHQPHERRTHQQISKSGMIGKQRESLTGCCDKVCPSREIHPNIKVLSSVPPRGPHDAVHRHRHLPSHEPTLVQESARARAKALLSGSPKEGPSGVYCKPCCRRSGFDLLRWCQRSLFVIERGQQQREEEENRGHR